MMCMYHPLVCYPKCFNVVAVCVLLQEGFETAFQRDLPRVKDLASELSEVARRIPHENGSGGLRQEISKETQRNI